MTAPLVQSPRRAALRAGFTLVELLVVIAIIGLLVAVLIPAVTTARRQAKVTQTKATLASIGTAIGQFEGDSRIGGSAPPSFSDVDNTNTGLVNMPAGEVANPYSTLFGARSFRISGAGLLVWALSGADRQGTPGFKPTRGSGRPWASDTDDRNTNDQPASSGAYALRSDGSGRPLHARSAAYLDDSKARITEWNAARQSFDIPAEVEARGGGGGGPLGAGNIARQYPMYLDSFGYPILYYRADPAGVIMADNWNPSAGAAPTGAARGIYHRQHNADLIDTSSGLLLRAGAPNHKLQWQDLPAGNTPLPATYQNNFAAYIYNSANKATRQPKNASTYLLISPGPDAVYGTSDDICNFEHNGR